MLTDIVILGRNPTEQMMEIEIPQHGRAAWETGRLEGKGEEEETGTEGLQVNCRRLTFQLLLPSTRILPTWTHFFGEWISALPSPWLGQHTALARLQESFIWGSGAAPLILCLP